MGGRDRGSSEEGESENTHGEKTGADTWFCEQQTVKPIYQSNSSLSPDADIVEADVAVRFGLGVGAENTEDEVMITGSDLAEWML